MTSKLCNLEYYIEVFLEIQKLMEVREEGMEVQKEIAFHVFMALLVPTTFSSNANLHLFVFFYGE